MWFSKGNKDKGEKMNKNYKQSELLNTCVKCNTNLQNVEVYIGGGRCAVFLCCPNKKCIRYGLLTVKVQGGK